MKLATITFCLSPNSKHSCPHSVVPVFQNRVGTHAVFSELWLWEIIKTGMWDTCKADFLQTDGVGTNNFSTTWLCCNQYASWVFVSFVDLFVLWNLSFWVSKHYLETDLWDLLTAVRFGSGAKKGFGSVLTKSGFSTMQNTENSTPLTLSYHIACLSSCASACKAHRPNIDNH